MMIPCRRRNYVRAGAMAFCALAVGVAMASRPSEVAPQAAAPAPIRLDSTGGELPHGALARLGTDRFRHNSPILHAAFSADGQSIFAGSIGEQFVRVWDVATGRERRRLPVTIPGRFAVSPDGKRLAFDAPESVHIVDLMTGNTLCTLAHAGNADRSPLAPMREEFIAFQFLEFIGDSDHVAAASALEPGISLWDISTRRLVGHIGSEEGPISAAAVSANGQAIVTNNGAGDFTLWNATDGSRIRKLIKRSEAAFGLAITPDGSVAIAALSDQSIQVWDLRTGKRAAEVSLEGYAVGLAAAPDGRSFAAAETELETTTTTVRIRAVSDARVIRKMVGTIHGHVRLVYSPDGAKLAAVGAGNSVRIWSVATGEEIHRGPGHTGAVTTTAFSPDGRRAATCSVNDSTVYVWDVGTGQVVRTLPDHPAGVDEVQFSPNGKWLATGAWEHPVFIWDIGTGRCLQSFDGRPSIGPHFRFSTDSKTIAIAGKGGAVSVWNCESGKLISERTEPAVELASLQSFADGKLLGIERCEPEDESEICTVPLWDLTSGRLLRRFRGHRGMVSAAVLSPDGRSLATRGDDQTIRVWEVATGRERRSFHDAAEPSGWSGTQFLAFSPNGRILASCGTHDPFPRLWDLATGKELAPLPGHHGWIGAIEFSPDGRELLTGSQDTSAIVWDMSERIAGHECPLSAAELQKHWEALANADSSAAYSSLWALVSAGDPAVQFIRERLKPDTGIEQVQIVRWIEQLDNSQFAVRERATAGLAKAVDEAFDSLQRALPSAAPEARERIHRILDNRHETIGRPERLRAIRSLEVLEIQGTPAARDLLTEFSHGSPQAPLTREAHESLRRMDRRAAR